MKTTSPTTAGFCWSSISISMPTWSTTTRSLAFGPEQLGVSLIREPTGTGEVKQSLGAVVDAQQGIAHRTTSWSIKGTRESNR